MTKAILYNSTINIFSQQFVYSRESQNNETVGAMLNSSRLFPASYFWRGIRNEASERSVGNLRIGNQNGFELKTHVLSLKNFAIIFIFNPKYFHISLMNSAPEPN